jgi:hypothetical protein
MVTVIYALPAGETRRWYEEIISEKCKTDAEIDRVIEAATADGWHDFRIVDVYDCAPDFAGTVTV